jgi:hypothetical protein
VRVRRWSGADRLQDRGQALIEVTHPGLLTPTGELAMADAGHTPGALSEPVLLDHVQRLV